MLKRLNVKLNLGELILWGLIILALVLHIQISSKDNPGFWTDSFIYLLQADYFSNWSYQQLPVYEQAMSYRSFPPLYPFFLSIIGAGSDDIALASIATSMLLFPVIFFYVDWQIKQGLSRYYAFINAIIFLLMPSTILFSTELWSENLYLLFSVMTLWCFSKFKISSNYNWLYLCAFICGLTLITRSVGIALVIPLIIVIYFHAKNKLAPVLLMIFIPSLIWLFFSNTIEYEQTYITSGFLGRYKSFIYAYGGVWEGLSTIVWFQAKTLWLGLQLQFNTVNNISTAILSAFIIASTTYILYKRLFVLSLDAVYVGLYLCLIFIWNFSDQNVRFIYVVVPFILFYIQYASEEYSSTISNNLSILIRSITPLLIVIIMLPSLSLIYSRLNSDLGESLNNITNDRNWLTGIDANRMHKHLMFKKKLIESVVETKTIVPQDECIYTIYQELVMLYGKRRSIVPPLEGASQQEFIEELTECRYIFVVASKYRDQKPMYPIDRVKNTSWILKQSFYPPEYGGEVISVLLEIESLR